MKTIDISRKSVKDFERKVSEQLGLDNIYVIVDPNLSVHDTLNKRKENKKKSISKSELEDSLHESFFKYFIRS